MQSASLRTASIAAGVTSVSRPSAGRPGLGLRNGSTARNFCHIGSVSTTRSRRTGRFPIGATVGVPPTGEELGDRGAAGESGAPVDSNRAGAAGSLPAAAAEGERAVDVVLDLLEAVEQRRALAHLQLERLQARPARDGVEALDPQLDAH